MDPVLRVSVDSRGQASCSPRKKEVLGSPSQRCGNRGPAFPQLPAQACSVDLGGLNPMGAGLGGPYGGTGASLVDVTSSALNRLRRKQQGSRLRPGKAGRQCPGLRETRVLTEQPWSPAPVRLRNPVLPLAVSQARACCRGWPAPRGAQAPGPRAASLLCPAAPPPSPPPPTAPPP